MSSTASPPSLPPFSPSAVALFLDFDGTLADIAPRPEAVALAPGVLGTLGRLAQALQGALAIVSGRRLADLDHFLAPLRLPVAAEHGALRRLPCGRLTEARPPDLEDVTHAAEELVSQYPGLHMERKTSSVALHYRQRPDLAQTCLAAMAEACDRTPGTELLHGKCVVEVKPLGVDKGHAIACFMKEAPFAGRQPWFAGDDVTDESGFDWVQRAGGAAIKVGEGASAARHRLGSPAQLRHWLKQAASAPPPNARGPG